LRGTRHRRAGTRAFRRSRHRLARPGKDLPGFGRWRRGGNRPWRRSYRTSRSDHRRRRHRVCRTQRRGRRRRRHRAVHDGFGTRLCLQPYRGMNRTSTGQWRADRRRGWRLQDGRLLRLHGRGCGFRRRLRLSVRTFRVPLVSRRLDHQRCVMFFALIRFRRDLDIFGACLLRRQVRNIESIQATQFDGYVFID
jgi:hypothetical protein